MGWGRSGRAGGGLGEEALPRTPPPPPPPPRQISEPCSPAPRPPGPSRSSALHTEQSQRRSDTFPADKDRLGARSLRSPKSRHLRGSSGRSGPAGRRQVAPWGETRRQRRCSRRHPRPCARGWPRGPGGGGRGSPPFLPLPLAFLPSASSRGTPASRGPGVPRVLPGALASLARPRCLLKVTRRSSGEQGTPALAAACAAAHPSACRGARPGRPCCRLLPPQSRLLNQRGEARPPPPGCPAPRLPGPRLVARAPPTPWPRAPAAAPLAAGLRQALHKPGRARVELYKAGGRRRGGRLEASPGPAGRRKAAAAAEAAADARAPTPRGGGGERAGG